MLSSVFLISFLSCSQLNSMILRLDEVAGLNAKQKKEIILELKKVSPTCQITFKRK